MNGTSGYFQRVGAGNLGGLPTGNADRTMFVLAKYNSSTWWAGAAYGTAAPNEAFALTVQHPDGELVLQGWGENDLVSTATGIGAGWLVHSGLVTGGNGTLFKNGTQVAHTYNTVLAKMVIGQDITGDGFVGMDIAAVLIYNRALSPTERASVESYLRSKYIQNSAPTVVISAPGNPSTHSAGAPIVRMLAQSNRGHAHQFPDCAGTRLHLAHINGS